MERQSRSWIMPVVFLTLLLCIGGGLISRFTQRNDYSLEELNQAMEKNQVTEVYIRPNREVPTGKILVRLKTGEEKEFTALDVKEIQEMVEKSGEDISVKVGDVPGDNTLLTSILSLGLTRRDAVLPLWHDEPADVRRRKQCQDDEFRKKPCQNVYG